MNNVHNFNQEKQQLQEINLSARPLNQSYQKKCSDYFNDQANIGKDKL